MESRKAFLDSLKEYTEEELIYKKFYSLRDKPDEKRKYMDEIEDYVRKHYLLIFDFPFITYPELLTEDDLYSTLSITKGSNVNIVRHLRYTPVFWHSHSFFTVLYVLSGQCGHKVGDLDVPMKQGDVFFLPPYVKQTIEVFDDSLVLNLHIRADTFGDYFFNVLRRGSMLSNFFIESLFSKNQPHGIMFHTGDSEEIRDLYLDLYQEVLLDDAYSWRLLDNMVPILFAKLLRGYSDTSEVIGGTDQSKHSSHLNILSYIYEHYRDITLEELARHFNYSVPHISRLIREETDHGFVDIVRKVRMGHATALLRTTDIPVAEIGDQVGYENTESFIRAFKKINGMSPSVYRKKTRKSSE